MVRHVAAIIGTSVFIVSCAGGGRVSKSEYLADANGVCASANKDAVRFANGAWPPNRQPTFPEFVVYLDSFVPRLASALEDLRELEPPEKDESEVERILASFDRAYQGFLAIREAIRRRDQRAFDSAWDRTFENAQAAQYAAAVYGMSACANFGWIRRTAFTSP